MKKLDKLIIRTFLGPFVITLLVVVFILLNQNMLKYFDDFVGKDLGVVVFSQILFFFSIIMTPNAIPLAVLLSALMTFGNLGEHFELTAIKGAGISLVRVMRPVFFLVVAIAFMAYFSNNYIVPKAALKAYSLLYDIKQTKPSLDIREGAFYNGIPGYSIKINEKFDNGALKDIIIYDHTDSKGNKEVILADSGRMFNILDNRYLKIELFNGHSFSEGDQDTRKGRNKNKPKPFVRNKFKKSAIVFSLESFDMQRTREDLFKSNRMMKTERELRDNLDSMYMRLEDAQYDVYKKAQAAYRYHLDKMIVIPPVIENAVLSRDTLFQQKRIEPKKIEFSQYVPTEVSMVNMKKADELINTDDKIAMATIRHAANHARKVKNNLKVENGRLRISQREINYFSIEWFRKKAMAFSCIVMFLIGAPLGAIIKRGGLGFPVLISFMFFIIFYVFNMVGEKMGREGFLDPFVATWLANMVLLPFGLVFLMQAKRDARLFEFDYYVVWFSKLFKRKNKAI